MKSINTNGETFQTISEMIKRGKEIYQKKYTCRRKGKRRPTRHILPNVRDFDKIAAMFKLSR
jgi:hypothetical protein